MQLSPKKSVTELVKETVAGISESISNAPNLVMMESATVQDKIKLTGAAASSMAQDESSKVKEKISLTNDPISSIAQSEKQALKKHTEPRSAGDQHSRRL